MAVKFPSVVMGMDASEYREAPALNASTITPLLDCPAMAFSRLWDAPAPTESMRLGTLVHALVLEPDEAPDRYMVLTEPGTTKAGKAQRRDAQEKGLEAVTGATWKTAQEMARSVREHPAVSKLLNLPGESEVSVFWRDEDHGVECKARIDRLVHLPAGLHIALDVKTAVSANPKDLGRKMLDFGYHRQAAWYLHGLESVGIPCTAFVFAFVRNSAPHLVSAVVLDEEALINGWTDCGAAMALWSECTASQNWPGYQEGIVTVSLPPWAYR